MLTAAAELKTFSAHIPAGPARLLAEVAMPGDAIGTVLFAHASGQTPQSARSRYVAAQLNVVRLGTVVVDLLTPDEQIADARTAALRLDIPFLAERLVQMLDWLTAFEPLEGTAIGLFGAGTGAAAALDAAMLRPREVRALVSRGGRPDLCTFLEGVSAPTLLIVGEGDTETLDLNSRCLARLRSRKRLEVIPGASHHFEEPGALERVAGLAAAWFHEHF